MSKEKIQQGDMDRAIEGTSGNRVFCSMAKTVNIGNYESIRMEFGMSKVIPDGEEFEGVKAAVKQEVEDSLADMLEPIEAAKG